MLFKGLNLSNTSISAMIGGFSLLGAICRMGGRTLPDGATHSRAIVGPHWLFFKFFSWEVRHSLCPVSPVRGRISVNSDLFRYESFEKIRSVGGRNKVIRLPPT